MTNRNKAIAAIHRKLKSRNVEIIDIHHKYIPKKHILKRGGKEYRFGGLTQIVAIHDGNFPPITVTSFRSGHDKWDKVEGEFQSLRKLVGMLPEPITDEGVLYIGSNEPFVKLTFVGDDDGWHQVEVK